jgi:hypothetical protein
MYTSPEAHARFVDQVDQMHGGQVKPLIRMIKSWKYHCNVPLRSFYIENAVALWAKSQTVIVHTFDIYLFLHFLLQSRLAELPDPSGISGSVVACAALDVNICLSKLERAAAAASEARSFHDKLDVRATLAAYDKVFGGKFPGYYY